MSALGAAGRSATALPRLRGGATSVIADADSAAAATAAGASEPAGGSEPVSALALAVPDASPPAPGGEEPAPAERASVDDSEAALEAAAGGEATSRFK